MSDDPITSQSFILPSEPILPLDSVVEQLCSSMPDVRWLLKEIESQDGRFRFPSFLYEAIDNLKIQNYPVLYMNEKAIAAVFLKGFMSDEEIREFNNEIEAASLDDRGELLRDVTSEMEDAIQSMEIPKTQAERDAAHEKFLALPEGEQKAAIRIGQHFYAFFITSFFQALSVMVHGEKLTSLVAQAMAGDDDAFVKAVQIDHRILTEIPYFKSRFAKARSDASTDFFDKISYRLKTAPFRGKIRHKSLWYTFAMLEHAGWLNTLTYRQILDVCDKVGLNGYENRIQSEKQLGNRIREYREFQKRGIVTTH